MTTRHFINLTNGLQAIEEYGLDPRDVRFIRIQSTWCEQKRWEDILMALSDDFLMQAALGHECVVYDYGAGKPVPRAVWQGLEWVKFVLWRRWHSASYVPEGRAAWAWGYFDKVYYCLSDRAKARVDYFHKFVTGPLRIRAVTSATELDGKTEEHVRMAKGAQLANGPARMKGSAP